MGSEEEYKYECPILERMDSDVKSDMHDDSSIPEIEDQSLGMESEKFDEKKEKPLKRKTYELKCHVCQRKTVGYDTNPYNIKRQHSIIHTDIMLYKCRESCCKFKTNNQTVCSKHYLVVHGKYIDEPSPELSDEDELELQYMILRCFPITDLTHEHPIVPPTMTCKKCGRILQVGTDGKARGKTHALTHTDLKIFKCPFKGCDYGGRYNNNLSVHIRAKHNADPLSYPRKQLSLQEKRTLNDMAFQCFPQLAKYQHAKYECQLCHMKIKGMCDGDTEDRRRHALVHCSFHLYKCNVPKCPFKTKYERSMRSHDYNEHQGKTDLELLKIKLTPMQEFELKSIVGQCFPDLNGV